MPQVLEFLLMRLGNLKYKGYIYDQISSLRRSADRGLNLALEEDKKFIDIFQHINDELERLEKILDRDES